MKRFQEVWDFVRSNIEKAQQRQKAQADKHRREVDFDVGDNVMVSTKRWDTGRPSKKLDHQAAGPFPIVDKVGHAYRLRLDDGINVHPVFAPEKLRRASSSEPLPGQILDKAPPIKVNNQQEWEVDEILDSKLRWRKLHYRVKWTGHDPDLKWYLASNFKNAPRRLKAFHERYPEKPGPPVNLPKWLEAEENDVYLDDDPLDAQVAVVAEDYASSGAWGQAPIEGRDNVTIRREVIRKRRNVVPAMRLRIGRSKRVALVT